MFCYTFSFFVRFLDISVADVLECYEIRSSVISARGSWEFLVIEKLLSINGKPECNDMDDDDHDHSDDDRDHGHDHDFDDHDHDHDDNDDASMMIMMIVILEVSSYRKIAFH